MNQTDVTEAPGQQSAPGSPNGAAPGSGVPAGGVPAGEGTSAWPPAANGSLNHGLERLGEVSLVVTVELGRRSMSMREVLALRPGAVIELDRPAGSAVDLLVNGTLFARGEVVVVDDDLGLRITEIVGPETVRSVP